MHFGALPNHLAGVPLHDSRDDLHERRLAGAIFADKDVHFSPVNREIAIDQGRYAAVTFLDVIEFEEHRKRTVYRNPLRKLLKGSTGAGQIPKKRFQVIHNPAALPTGMLG